MAKAFKYGIKGISGYLEPAERELLRGEDGGWRLSHESQSVLHEASKRPSTPGASVTPGSD